MPDRPVLVVVSGPRGSGKATLAHRIAEAVGCPAICRDEIKEGMVHANPGFVPGPGDELTMRTLPVFFGVLELLLTALPEVEETSHFRFRAPVFKVRGRTFLGLGQGETTAVFCISEQQANDAAAADPAACAAVRRQDARRTFLGLQVDLRNVSEERIRWLVERAWRPQAPSGWSLNVTGQASHHRWARLRGRSSSCGARRCGPWWCGR